MPGDDARTDDGTERADATDGTGGTDSHDGTDGANGGTDGADGGVDGSSDGADGGAADSSDGGFDLSRRKAVVGGLGVLVGAVAGAGATFATGGSREIQAETPNSDGKGTLGELRWILEEKHQLAVTSMVETDGTVELTYETSAQDRAQSRQEIGGVVSAYGLIVANDGPTDQLAASITGRFEGQATSYHVEADWVKQWHDGEISDAGVAQRVFNTRTFPEGSEPE